MKSTEEKKKKNAVGTGAIPKTPCDPDCSFDDIFVSPLHVNAPPVDSSYLHERPGFLARLFGRRRPLEPKKVA